MADTWRIKNTDLVLKVTSNVDAAQFDFTKYEAFIDTLCGTREYQKEAIRTVCNYLFGNAYPNLRALAEENYYENPVLRERYADFGHMVRALEFPSHLASSVDLATGTGKSYVMYGIARIALTTGKIDRVLVLCPSNTIEAGLIAKFREASKQGDLTGLLPPESVIANPHVINATETITVGDICVENIHATYERTRSSIQESFKGNGARTLVLCDEAHHIYSPERNPTFRKWKEFLLSSEFGFKYIVGFSGTCYIGNEYFTDVVLRYPLRQAIEDGFVKSVEYVAEDASGDQNEKFQKIYSNHVAAKRTYRRLRPLTILVTKDIPACKRLSDDLAAFIARKEDIPKDQALRRILRVHSKRNSGHGLREDRNIPSNIARLRAGEPDRKDSPIEWITSVSMLTEGWDVQNVFQIVPHEERAFNSKLLIAQVLGRGLRVPELYRGERPVVTVFNHDRWSQNIRHLVDEILEIERRVLSFPVSKEPNYDFTLHHIDYTKAEYIVETKQESEYNFSMRFVNLAAQRQELERDTIYERAVTGEHRTKRTHVTLEMFSIEQVILDVHNKFRAIDLETGTKYSLRYTRNKIRTLIRTSLDRIGYEGSGVSKENRQRILSAFGNLYRPGSKSIRYSIKPSAVNERQVQSRPKDSVGIASLRRGATVFYDDEAKRLDPELSQVLSDLEKDESRLVSALVKIDNRFHFRTCLSVVLTASEPERKFVRGLVQPENANEISGWIKNTDMGFYEIEYSYSRGDYSKRGNFSPDFFLNLGGEIVIVEIKGDEEISEPSAESKGKRKAAVAHFNLLNARQEEVRYHLCFLSPRDYDLFFAELREGHIAQFQSSLDVALMNG